MQQPDIYPCALSFIFKDGDVLMLKDHGRNAVMQIVSISYDCGTVSLRPPCRLARLSFDIPPLTHRRTQTQADATQADAAQAHTAQATREAVDHDGE